MLLTGAFSVTGVVRQFRLTLDGLQPDPRDSGSRLLLRGSGPHSGGDAPPAAKISGFDLVEGS